MTTTAPSESHARTASYKHMWARYVAKSTMDYDLKGAVDLAKKVQEKTDKIPDSKVIEGGESIGELWNKTKKLTGEGFVPKERGKIDVGIVGAGVAGLFTALLFDWLNEHPDLKGKGLDITYEILEAAGEDRLGGRLYTHHFTDKEHDYYDVGAMRFPNNSIMRRTFQLFKYIGITQDSEGAHLIPYYLKDVKGTCPSYFNDVSKVGNVWTDKADDPYEINIGLPANGKIPPPKDPNKLVSEALAVFIDEIRTQFQKVVDEDDENRGKKATALGQKKDEVHTQEIKDDVPLGPGYNYNTIEWLETATYGTGWYDQALTECVLEELDFQTDDSEPGNEDTQYWWCVDGGAQEVAKKMAKMAKQPVQYHTRAEAIKANMLKRKDPKTDPNAYMPITLRTATTDPKTNKTTEKNREYFAIFNSTTLASLQRMDLQDAGLLWGTKQAIRALGYGASAKVGMKFKTAWWQKAPFNITQGGVSRTDLPLRVCVYPSYNIEKNEGNKFDANKPAVLLCSYTWGQDAQRIGSLCSPDTPKNEEELKKVMLHDLALLHANKECPYEELLKILKDQYVEHHSWDWYRDPNMSGAFAYFGPGQFSNMWQEIIKPNSFGQLYLVGEASSSHHAWIVGALESVVRAVYIMFQGLLRQDPDCDAYKIVLRLLSTAPTDPGEKWDKVNNENPQAPMKKNGALPEGLPFHPLPEEMPTYQYRAKKDTNLTLDPSDEAGGDSELTYGAAVALLSLIESYLQALSAEVDKPAPR
ncbi:hypothetical protein NM208_g6884 [Fusarium decemcellulare]|uniref:Uncharacterized protein n=1 Tax=Fusarium decemcellulare TaxID=57161 RepID=A0ACC1SBH1_9HYPO|nr:hypothetical protein NM208_g6884 [Fusarium decemcellulare]